MSPPSPGDVSPLEDEQLSDTPLRSFPLATETSSYESQAHSRASSTRSPPSKPIQEVVPVPSHGIWGILADIFCVVAPLGFVTFGIVILKTQNVLVNLERDQYGQVITVMATLFPITFAYVLGRLMVQVARWNLERGARLRFLEQLIGSRSVGGSISTAIHFPLSLFTPALLAIWAFSPLGAQAILRIHGTEMRPNSNSTSFEFFDTRARSWAHSFNLSYNNDLFNVALLTSDGAETAPADLYGKVKIPVLSSYGREDISDWQDVPSRDFPDRPTFSYSSLLGVPVTGMWLSLDPEYDPPLFNQSFDMWSTYIELECETIEVDYNSTSPTGRVPSRLLFNETSLSRFSQKRSNFSTIPNGTWHGFNRNNVTTKSGASRQAMWNLAADTFIDEQRKGRLYTWDLRKPPLNATDIVANPMRLLFQVSFQTAEYGNFVKWVWGEYFRAIFKVSQKYVESRLECQGGHCRVVAQRTSQKPHPPEALTQLSIPQTFAYISHNMAKLHPGDAQLNLGLEDPVVGYLAGLKVDDMLIWQGRGVRNEIAKTTKQALATRLGILLNTYLQIGQNSPEQLVGKEIRNKYRLKTPDGGREWRLENTYVVHKGWFSVYMVSCLVLLAGGVASVLLYHLCYGPEILGFASTVVRDSRFINMLPHSRGLDGMDITAAAGKERIRYGYTLLKDGDGGGGPETVLLGVGLQDEVTSIRRRKEHLKENS